MPSDTETEPVTIMPVRSRHLEILANILLYSDYSTADVTRYLNRRLADAFGRQSYVAVLNLRLSLNPRSRRVYYDFGESGVRTQWAQIQQWGVKELVWGRITPALMGCWEKLGGFWEREEKEERRRKIITCIL
ncbi:hypothetical protein G7Y79_00033g068710 [Physcia stellaris]|nr:hypothetical protein G7Y79_00033g068710 [Physcia stellaris]